MTDKPKTVQKPKIGAIVIYRTDGRNGLVYDLPAMITCTQDSHPGDYIEHEDSCPSINVNNGACDCTPTIRNNPLPVPDTDENEEVHLTVFTPGGFGTQLMAPDDNTWRKPNSSRDFKGAENIAPGSGTYVELSVPRSATPQPRTWRWPVIS